MSRGRQTVNKLETTGGHSRDTEGCGVQGPPSGAQLKFYEVGFQWQR